MSNAIRMSRDSVAAVISPEAMARVRELFHSEMIFGPHHVWEHGAVLFTSAGVVLLVDRLREEFPGDALALQAELSARGGAVADNPAPPPEPMGGPRKRGGVPYWEDRDL